MSSIRFQTENGVANMGISMFRYIPKLNESCTFPAIDARLRYNPREGNDFYLVYNEGLNTNLYRETPSLPRSEARVLMAKYTYTFSF